MRTEAQQFEDSMKRVREAEDALLTKLFGYVPAVPGDHEVPREDYIAAMQEVEKEFKLEEGDTDMVLFVLEQLSRSPRFKKELSINETNEARCKDV